MPAELATLTDARGEPMGEWTSEPMPGTRGRWVRLVVVRANEWSPAVRAGREEEAARAVAALDMEAALCRGSPAGPSQNTLHELVDGRVLLHSGPLTAEMLEAFGWDPPGGPPIRAEWIDNPAGGASGSGYPPKKRLPLAMPRDTSPPLPRRQQP